MDIFAHGLWSFAVFHKSKQRWWAVLFGLSPDLLAFGPFFLWRLVAGSFVLGRPELATIPSYVIVAYNVTHSLIVFLAVFLMLYLGTKQWFLPLLAWGLHVVIDIPTHTHAFFPTPFLWPLSTVRVDGISWADPAFMVLNYLALFTVYFFIFLKKRKQR